MSELQTLPELDVECDNCHGEGQWQPDYYCPPRSVECHVCEGLGRIPTEFGEKVLTFVLSRLKLTTTVR